MDIREQYLFLNKLYYSNILLKKKHYIMFIDKQRGQLYYTLLQIKDIIVVLLVFWLIRLRLKN